MLLAIHVAAGGLAMILGAGALLVEKGGTVHRLIGLLFVYSMLIMGATASMLALLKTPVDRNVTGGLMTAYFVGTAVATVRPASSWTRWVNGALFMVAVGFALSSIVSGVKAFSSPGRALNGVPFGMNFFLAGVMIAAAVGDVRLMRSPVLRRGPRLARHLWRMCFALFIAAGSFFSIEHRVAKVLPAPFTSAPVRGFLMVAPFLAMFYWLWRVRRRPYGAGTAH